MVIMKMTSGALCHINCSRRAVYGYDQRLEAFGPGGMLLSNNRTKTTVERYGKQATAAREPLLNFFIERYSEAYFNQVNAFVDAVEQGAPSGTQLRGRSPGADSRERRRGVARNQAFGEGGLLSAVPTLVQSATNTAYRFPLWRGKPVEAGWVGGTHPSRILSPVLPVAHLLGRAHTLGQPRGESSLILTRSTGFAWRIRTPMPVSRPIRRVWQNRPGWSELAPI